MAQQTAVQWLIEEWLALKCQLPTWLVEQAKAMEKEQIIKAFNEGTFSLDEKINSEEYYNQTYAK